MYGGFRSVDIPLASKDFDFKFDKSKDALKSFFKEKKPLTYGVLYSPNIANTYSFSIESNFEYYKFTLHFGSAVF